MSLTWRDSRNSIGYFIGNDCCSLANIWGETNAIFDTARFDEKGGNVLWEGVAVDLPAGVKRIIPSKIVKIKRVNETVFELFARHFENCARLCPVLQLSMTMSVLQPRAANMTAMPSVPASRICRSLRALSAGRA